MASEACWFSRRLLNFPFFACGHWPAADLQAAFHLNLLQSSKSSKIEHITPHSYYTKLLGIKRDSGILMMSAVCLLSVDCLLFTILAYTALLTQYKVGRHEKIQKF